jgi:hypothetical protein
MAVELGLCLVNQGITDGFSMLDRALTPFCRRNYAYKCADLSARFRFTCEAAPEIVTFRGTLLISPVLVFGCDTHDCVEKSFSKLRSSALYPLLEPHNHPPPSFLEDAALGLRAHSGLECFGRQRTFRPEARTYPNVEERSHASLNF